jgi:hypothetical protein
MNLNFFIISMFFTKILNELKNVKNLTEQRKHFIVLLQLMLNKIPYNSPLAQIEPHFEQ